MRSSVIYAFLLSTLATIAVAQSPSPEFFGVYALAHGKLYSVERSAVSSPQTAIVAIGSRSPVADVLNGKPIASRSPTHVPELPATTQFVVYYQSAMAMASGLKLMKLVYVNHLTVDTGWPNNVNRGGVEDAWDLVEGAVETIPLLMQPYRSKADMVLAVPSKPLVPSLYVLTGGDSSRMRYLFIVAPTEATKARCVDVTCRYAMMTEQCTFVSCVTSGSLAASSSGSRALSQLYPLEEVHIGGSGCDYELRSPDGSKHTVFHSDFDDEAWVSLGRRDVRLKLVKSTDANLQRFVGDEVTVTVRSLPAATPSVPRSPESEVSINEAEIRVGSKGHTLTVRVTARCGS